MEKNFERIDPRFYDIKDGIKIFRGSKGDVSIDNPNKVIIRASPEDTVDLVCLTSDNGSDSGQIYFWSIPFDDRTILHALRSRKSCSLPSDVTFEDMYKSSKPHLAAGYFVKYTTSGVCGILYISKLEIRSVISHTHNYSDISFENDMFYASRDVPVDTVTSDCTKTEYVILNIHGKVLKKSDFKIKKIPGFDIYYNNNSVFFKDSSAYITVNSTISFVSVVKPNKHQFPEWILIRIKTEDETYYYTKELKPLARLLSDDILLAEPDGLFLLETQESRITRAFHIGVDGSSGGLVKELLTVPVIEKVYVRENSANANECIQVIPNLGKTFFATANALYSFNNSKFITIFNNVSNVANYKFVDAINELYPSNSKIETLYGIIGFSEKNMPVCFAAYDDENTIRYSEILDVIESGFTLNNGITQYICHGKSTNQIVVTDEKSIIFCTGGKTASCRPVHNITRWNKSEGIPIYLVEFDKGNIIMNINAAGQILI